MRKIFLIFFISLLIISCSTLKPKATGDETEIITYVDSLLYSQIERDLKFVFHRLIYTPQPESLFAIKPEFQIYSIDKLKYRKNLMFVSTLDDKSDIGLYILNMLDPASKELVQKDSAYIFIKNDLWSKGQIVLILIAKDKETLLKHLRKDRNEIYIYFRDEFFRREMNAIISEGHNKKDIEKYLLEKYNWKIFVQHDYYIAKDSAQEKFVWLRRRTPEDMERFIFVHWIDSVYDPYKFFNQVWIANKRNEITKKFYRTTRDDAWVVIADDPESIKYLYFFPVNFNGRYAIRVQGLWRFNDFTGGGPFISYVFYDSTQKRIYFLDGSIFAPRYEKKKLIIQIDAILHTFKTASEIKG
ncbi:protein of unknown function (DUF4837) [Candidatus Kryptonium thompsonii]|uniref:DUF4837 domain-containing protein n=1 Tax=Candidatus Kryptonium thompsonii TaxID=1633631 RepID=A0A0P1LJ43_9BACT|nr:DUF4837 family protein [Candidatus Kryptonium thompsoni]CUS77605.1 protein of unknown function (DUF4837) [Candidatus Kryptonium thompsoni]CUS81802.1 protein of unknown function (DUF4837) [Candidatus Kryptonium thompsoni]CUS88667.1 protein of unknown function (DUF4837) [Candidatus Kryptonium thompsoni]CUS90403.1 protein of unknown function (DUF4837) [Candidatus Kryptonium thompsoni]CUS97797.1 protein of unknown function (DUF4837) [Candidatus Kryptonium thompsoni]